jgi:hypothetical protein
VRRKPRECRSHADRLGVTEKPHSTPIGITEKSQESSMRVTRKSQKSRKKVARESQVESGAIERIWIDSMKPGKFCTDFVVQD